MSRWDIAAFVLSEDTDLLDAREFRIADIDRRYSGDDRPVLTTMLMRLEREALSWMDDELLHLIER